jgi:hypothetical protein
VVSQNTDSRPRRLDAASDCRPAALDADRSDEILKHFKDSDLIPLTMRRYFGTAVDHKIIAMPPADKDVLRPQSALSRAEFATVLVRLEQFFSNK